MNKENKYVSGKQACEILGVYMQTLYIVIK